MTKRQATLFPDMQPTKTYVADMPELAAEWHPAKNKALIPEDILHGSNRRVWWQCAKGHEWQAAVVSRTIYGTGCPYCAGQRVSSENNLAARYPEVAKYWSLKNELRADQVVAKSGKLYLWQCDNGHEYKNSPHRLVRQKFLCPHCTYEDRGDGLRKATPELNLTTEHPDLAAEWHQRNKKPATFYMPKSSDKVWWQCANGHEWQATINNRSKGKGCPYCASRKPSSVNNFGKLYPELLAEWHYLKNPREPNNYTPKSSRKVWWLCARGHEWEARIANRVIGGTGCPRCTNQQSKNELRIYTELASAFGHVEHRHKVNGVEVDVYLSEHNLAVEYDGSYWHKDKLDKDHEKQQKLEALGINLLRVREAPLKQLGNHDIVIKTGSLLTKKVMNQIVAFIDPDSSYLKLKGFTAEDTYLKYIDYFPSPFPEKSLAKVMPELAAQWHPTKNAPLTPENFTDRVAFKAWWQCEEGHEWQASIKSRTLGNGCPYCRNYFVNKDNCMVATNPEMAAMFHPTKNAPLTPSDVVAGTGKRLWWQCQCGHEWQQRGDYYKRRRILQPCSKCRER
ncbi:zinc-ribbon domain-containing protein [Paracoccaceae bacterium]|nr:zinc-ribbon domain-containing protein [Paracoccaceae bacterium]